MICKVKDGISMLSVVITVIVIIILSTIIIQSSSKSIYQAGENKIMQEITEVKKGVDSVRLANAKTGKTDEDTINRGFIKVRVENPPASFVSFDEDKLTGYVVDLSVIDYEKLESGRGYLSLMEDDIVTFDEDDVYVYDGAGKVYYAKGYQIGDGDLSYTAENDTRKDGPIVEVISTNNGVIKLKVTPIYGGEISSVIVGTKRATTSDGINFEFPVNKNGSYKVVATEEGGNSTVKIVEVGDVDVTADEISNLKDVYINNREEFTTNEMATLHIDADDAAYMSISQAGLIVPAPTDLGKWREYESEVPLHLNEGNNKVYVWCKNEDNVPTDYKMAEIILDSTPPTREAPTYVLNGFQILMSCQQTDAISENLEIEYGYRREDNPNFIWQDSPIIVDVEPGIKYVLITKATDEAGNSSESRSTLTEPIMTIPSDIEMTATPAEGWTSRVNVEIEYPNTYDKFGFQNLYRIDGGEWKEVSSNRTQMTIIKNSKIEAVVAVKPNGQDVNMGEIKSLDINNIDRVDPYIYDVEDIGPYRQDGFDIKAKVYDKESGLVAWTVTTSQTAPTSWANTFEATTEEVQMSYRVDVNDTYYFWVKDAGNNIGSSKIEVTNIDLYDPIINSFNISYGIGKATITVKAIDEELGINAYAFMRGRDAAPAASDWKSVEQTITECTWTKEVTDNDYYSIWVRDVSGRTKNMEEYVRVKYTVTYDYKTNDGESATATSIIVGCNSNVDLSPTAEREYSSFIGWNTNPNAKTSINSLKLGDATTNQEDIIIYAIFKWEDEIYFTKSANNVVMELDLTIEKLIPYSTLQYSYDNSRWTNYTSPILITKNRTVYARTVINNEVIKTASIVINNICEEHNFSDATCTEISSCSICGKYNGPALGHDMGEWYVTVAETCTTAGTKRRDCVRFSNCGKYETEIIPTHGHSYGAWTITKNGNCVEQGSKTRTCTYNCGSSETVATDKDPSNHKGPIQSSTTAATCTTAGNIRKYCYSCNVTTGNTQIPATGHDYTTATCTTQGVCRNGCGSTIPATGHNYGQATCTTGGRCLNGCGSTIPATGHNYTEATCITAGICLNGCGSRIAALGHDWGGATAAPRKCARCGLEEKAAQAIYTASNKTLTFVNSSTAYKVGGTYNGKSITAVYTGFLNSTYSSSFGLTTDLNHYDVRESETKPTSVPWFSYAEVIEKVVVADEISPTSTANWFYDFKNCSTFDLTKLNTSQVTSMEAMFMRAGLNVENLSFIGLNAWNTGKVTNMSRMFMYTGKDWGILSGQAEKTGTATATWKILDKNNRSSGINSWNVANVKNMSYMFRFAANGAGTWTLGDLSNWNTAKVTDMRYMFEYAGSSLSTWYVGNLGKWDVAKVTNMRAMFKDAGHYSNSFNTGNLNNWKVGNVTDMLRMFTWTATSEEASSSWNIGDISGWDVSKVTTTRHMFMNVATNCSSWNIGNLNNWNVSNLVDAAGMFSTTAVNATSWNVGDLSGWKTSKIKDMGDMFFAAGRSATSWSVGQINKWDTSSVTKMSGMFNCAGRIADYTLDLSGWNVPNVTEYTGFNSSVTEKITPPVWQH